MTMMNDPVHFLLVDDLEENLLSLEGLLRREGLVLLKARSGPEALELLLKQEVALALLDVQMPGMDGFELAELMRGNERTGQVPIIFLTAGNADRQRRFQGYEAGAVDFLHKPIEPDILRSKAGVFFELYRQRQQYARQRDEVKKVAEENAQLLQESHEAREHLQLMVESAQDYAIISLDNAGIIVSWNSGAERIFGNIPDQMIGQPVSVIFTPEDREDGVPERELTTALEKGRASDERWHLRDNGERFYASGILAAMYDTAGQLKGFVKIARDMTKEQQAQEALLEARNAAEAANIAKTEFLANMSHEIRTPMNAVLGLASIIAMSEPLTQKQREFIKTLQLSAESLLALINDLLDISKIEARTVELENVAFSLTRVIEEVITMMGVRIREKDLRFTSDLESIADRAFLGDPTRIRQIILNLCSNAVKFTEQGGIHVSVSCHPTSNPELEEVYITVKDTGIGIASDKLETIFHKFVQADSSINRKYGGTGLGLAITKTLAEIMGGEIVVASHPGEGSEFTVRVPLEVATLSDIQESSGALRDIAEHTVEMGVRPPILLVEDYAANILVATAFLEEFGYRVDSAKNGLEAFEYIKRGSYIAVLMDVQMHGMNGYEATQLIREYEEKNKLPRLPIIGMTAHALSGDRERCLDAGMDDYIAKPFNPDELEEKLAAIRDRVTAEA